MSMMEGIENQPVLIDLAEKGVAEREINGKPPHGGVLQFTNQRISKEGLCPGPTWVSTGERMESYTKGNVLNVRG